jgi:tetratricopeptide (TPR) repeat protein
VGFIMAQRIIAYRDANGPFYAVEDLLNVSGFTTGTLEGIQERLVITATRPAAAPASAGSIGYSIAQAAPPELNEARDALGLGEVTQAIEKYAALVEADQYLEYVVQDLEEMVERRPDDIDLWQTLGDAYLHSDQVAKALEAYTKAERLLR